MSIIIVTVMGLQTVAVKLRKNCIITSVGQELISRQVKGIRVNIVRLTNRA